MKKRLLLFDYIRIVAFGLVILAHSAQRLHHPLGGFFGIKDFYYVSLGGLGVTLFIILSGMLLEYTYGDKSYVLKQFYLKRLTRIYIPYWILFLILLSTSVSSTQMGFKKILLNIFAVSVFTGAEWAEFTLGVSWFLGVIIVLYILFPLISSWVHKKPTLTIIALLVTSSISRWYVGEYWNLHRAIDWFPLGRLFEFCFGIWFIFSFQKTHIFRRIAVPSSSKHIRYISDISYPVFLLHVPILDSFNQEHTLVSIISLLLLTTILAHVLLLVSNYLQKMLTMS